MAAVPTHVAVPAGMKKQYKYEAVAVHTGTKWQYTVYNIYVATVMPIMGTAHDAAQYNVAAVPTGTKPAAETEVN